MAINNIETYELAMEKSYVIVDPAVRRKRTMEGVMRAAADAGGVHADDPELVDTVTHLVEYPSAVCGSFDQAFLDLPDAVLITAMREHQKYFAVYDEKGSLMPNFVAVNNTQAKDESVVCRGHERVLRARLSDADFFLKEDRKRPLMDRLEDLKQVIYQAQLGTSYAKVMRVEALAGMIAGKVLPEETETVKQVARLAKCDLVTHMVIEFPSLQGAVGKAYAELEGYDDSVCSAIYEHYLPLKAGEICPNPALERLWEWRTGWIPLPVVSRWDSSLPERRTPLPLDGTPWPLFEWWKTRNGTSPFKNWWMMRFRFWQRKLI